MEKLNELIEFYEMVGTEPQLLVWLLELRRHRESNWKQRAEAAEAALEVEKDIHDDTVQAMHLWCERAKEAEAKLAENEKQEPVGETVNVGWSIMVEWERCIPDGTQLFTRPAPAADLADLVPPEITHADAPELQEIASSARVIGVKGTYAGFAVGANWMRAAILRNIEGAGRNY